MENYTRRNKKIFELRRQGRTFSTIARKFGISEKRVQSICNEMEKREKWPAFRKLLPVETQRTLLEVFGESVFEHPEWIAAFDPKELLKLRDIGKVRLASISAALAMMGYAFAGSVFDCHPKRGNPRTNDVP